MCDFICVCLFSCHLSWCLLWLRCYITLKKNSLGQSEDNDTLVCSRQLHLGRNRITTCEFASRENMASLGLLEHQSRVEWRLISPPPPSYNTGTKIQSASHFYASWMSQQSYLSLVNCGPWKSVCFNHVRWFRRSLEKPLGKVPLCSFRAVTVMAERNGDSPTFAN